MTDNSIYDDIRPFRDSEVPGVMKSLLSSSSADLLISTVFPKVPIELVKQQLKDINSIRGFQEKIIYKAVLQILSSTSSGLTRSGTEHIKKGENNLLISNHRDIILDPCLLNTVIFEEGYDTSEVAIGDNLLETSWVKDLARMNKSFIVKRNLPVRELIIFSKRLSNYISETITQNKTSVWIAQREGRAKDGNDRTQPGLLNMIGMAASGSLKEHFINLNILPASISYEHDPCDVDKVRSLYALKFFGGYTKEKNEDNLAMRKGILGYKGNIHIHLGQSLNDKIAILPDDLHKSELIQQIGKLLDQQIIGNYRIQKSNRIAYDLIHGIDLKDDSKYSVDDKNEFFEDMNEKIDTLDGEPDELKTIFLEIYARPYQNKLDLLKKSES